MALFNTLSDEARCEAIGKINSLLPKFSSESLERLAERLQVGVDESSKPSLRFVPERKDRVKAKA